MTHITKYTIVQHSGYGYAGKEGFKQGLEVRTLNTIGEQRLVEKAGGLVFESWGDADDFCEANTGDGLYPVAKGTFSNIKIDGLRIYIPVRTVTG